MIMGHIISSSRRYPPRRPLFRSFRRLLVYTQTNCLRGNYESMDHGRIEPIEADSATQSRFSY